MAQGQLLFTLDYKQFNEIRGQANLFKLREEFNVRNTPLSRSLLIFQETQGVRWLLLDFEGDKTYDIRKEETDTIVEISDGGDIERRFDFLNDPGRIFVFLKEGLATDAGIVDALKKSNFDKFDIEGLRRSDLSGRRLNFQSVYPELSDVYAMLREIVTSSRGSLTGLPSTDIEQLKYYILQFYDMVGRITGFGSGATDARERHATLLNEICQFREDVKQSLIQVAAYLSSREVGQVEDRLKAALVSTQESFNTTISTEIERLQKTGEEAQEKEQTRQKSFDRLYIQLQNQLTEKSISQYKTIFSVQAKKHEKAASIWLIATVGLSVVFAGILAWLFKDLGSAANQLSTILPNLFSKGFYISLVYLLLNRCIKNYTAEKHLDVINTHRQNALETVDPFLEATKENRETRDQILLAATKTIYDANQSGYLSAKTSGSDSANPVQQIIKEVIPSKSSDKSD